MITILKHISLGKVDKIPVHHRKSIREKSLLVTLPPPSSKRLQKKNPMAPSFSSAFFPLLGFLACKRGKGRGKRAYEEAEEFAN